MSFPSTSRCAGATLAVLCSLLVPAVARADGDPASDTLYTQSVFLPYSTRVSPALALELDQAADAANRAGEPVRVALIDAPSDLGAIQSLFGQPKAYARFLGIELQFVYPGRLLVVMPDGAALSRKGRLVPSAPVDHAKVEPGGDGLASTALALVRALTRGAPVPARTSRPRRERQAATPSAPSPATATASLVTRRGIPVWEGACISVVAVCGVLLVGLALVRRRIRTNRLQAVPPVAVRPPNPDDPYRYTGPL